MRIATGIGILLLVVAIVLGLCAAAGLGMDHAYQSATPRINPGDAALFFGAAAAVIFAIVLFAAPRRLPVAIRIALSLCLFGVAAWLAFAAWIWAAMVG